MSKKFQFLAYIVSLFAVVLIMVVFTVILHKAPESIVLLSFMLVVLLCSLFLGVGPGLMVSIIGALGFNFFFLEPKLTFNISQPQDIATFLVFFAVTALIVSGLSAAVTSKAHETEKQKMEVEKLYNLARSLIEAPSIPKGAITIADQITKIFGFEYCGIHVPDKNGTWKKVSLSSHFPRGLLLPNARKLTISKLDEIAEEYGTGVRYTMLETPQGVVGMLETRSQEVSDQTVKALASLCALALQRNGIFRIHK